MMCVCLRHLLMDNLNTHGQSDLSLIEEGDGLLETRFSSTNYDF